MYWKFLTDASKRANSLFSLKCHIKRCSMSSSSYNPPSRLSYQIRFRSHSGCLCLWRSFRNTMYAVVNVHAGSIQWLIPKANIFDRWLTPTATVVFIQPPTQANVILIWMFTVRSFVKILIYWLLLIRWFCAAYDICGHWHSRSLLGYRYRKQNKAKQCSVSIWDIRGLFEYLSVQRQKWLCAIKTHYAYVCYCHVFLDSTAIRMFNFSAHLFSLPFNLSSSHSHSVLLFRTCLPLTVIPFFLL